MQPSDLEVIHGYVRVNGLRYHYVEKGSGPCVLLLHGFPENWWSWRYQIGPLAQAGFRVIVPDQRGYNGTDRTGPFDLDTLASDAAALLSALGETRAHVVGHDWGGAVAWHLASTRPRQVAKLVVLSCPHPARMVEALWSSRAQRMRSWPFLVSQVPLLPELGLRHFGDRILPHLYRRGATELTRLGAEETRPFVDGLKSHGAAKAMLDWHRSAFRRTVRQLGRVPEYPVIDAETLLLWGRDDAYLLHDACIPGTEQYAPQLTVEVIEGAGHFVQAERPEQVSARLTDFLGGLSQAEQKLTAPDDAAQPRAEKVERVTDGPKKAPTFTVVLSDAGENKIGVIKEIREITGLQVKAAKDLVEGAPGVVKEEASRQEAERIRRQLGELGATVEIQGRAVETNA